jgi:hypothetical protein
MPSGIVEYENDDAVTAGPGFLRESRQQLLEERFGDAVGNAPETFAGRGRDESRDVEPFDAVMAWRDRPRADGRPDSAHDRLQSEPVFVGGEGFDGDALIGLRYFRDDLGDFYRMAHPPSGGVVSPYPSGGGRLPKQRFATSPTERSCAQH